ncbi:outer membrane lipoprotein carrier protein LolA [Defluviimonas sp. WL0002]|uniref:Outer membrane lipoprotein carrier protein LolA n=1 Tax=Albidovulum marisflavi TaxID=2984159 RepID=A0ABT2Z7X8_9RHOB|nr:outer membrane lipoprotein carrier protein LolA [Defluviimonas sp. WL0002]MCV2867239.1 outer membrane lipoprotein carrier protein LolA [Defluviimonas sp. WL0002]
MKHILAAILTLAAFPAAAEKLSLSELSRYLNGLTTAEAAFTQFNADGTTSEGRVMIQRPGRMRFEYSPDATLVLASGGQLAIFDPKSNQPPEQYPLSKTPLNLILGRNIDLGRARMVVGHGEQGPLTLVVAQDPEHPEYGTLTLAFSSNPTALRQWTVTDETGNQTTVVLEDLKTGVTYQPSTFSIHYEVERRGLN